VGNESAGQYVVHLDAAEVGVVVGEMEGLIMEGHSASPVARGVILKLAAAVGIGVEALSQLAG
jgi:hypothetical protein